jgi:hypothetical protein
MTIAMQPIYTQTVGSGGVGSIFFTNIPQTFTDLKIVISLRGSFSSSFDSVLMQFNSDTANNYSYTVLAAVPSSYRASNQNLINPFLANGTTSTANTFSSCEVYIPNYASSNKKAMTIDVAGENNSAGTFGLTMTAALWSNTAAITQVYFQASNGNMTQYSTISIYGITKG